MGTCSMGAGKREDGHPCPPCAHGDVSMQEVELSVGVGAPRRGWAGQERGNPSWGE